MRGRAHTDALHLAGVPLWLAIDIFGRPTIQRGSDTRCAVDVRKDPRAAQLLSLLRCGYLRGHAPTLARDDLPPVGGP